MKILFINTTYKIGSTGRIVAELGNTIEAQGDEAFYAYGLGEHNNDEVHFHKMGDKLYRKCNILLTRLFGNHGYYNYIATYKLVNWIEKIHPDVIHLHNLHNHYLNVGILFAYIKKHNIPVIWTLHDNWSYTGWCANYENSGCERWKNGCHDCQCKNKYPFTWFFDRSKGNFYRKKRDFLGVDNLIVVTPSEWLAREVNYSFLNGYKMVVINNGIDINTFRPRKSDFKRNHKIEKMLLAVAGNWSKYKGIEFLQYIAANLEKDWTLVIVGINRKQRSVFEGKQAVLIPRTNDVNKLAGIYSSADVFINPTLEDIFPNVNMEALACGTPVVTFATGGAKETVSKDTGCIVQKGDWKEMLRTATQIIKKEELYINCVARAQELYDKDKNYQKYLELYQGMYQKGI